MKIEIVRIIAVNDEEIAGRTRGVKVIADGDALGDGQFGGEPEDNYEFRDYRWVIPLIASVAKACGAEVVLRKENEADDE